jgi:membrane protein implicated in regulation of membrane protease activity
MTNGILFNWSMALGAYAVGGALWATVVFLSIALVRVSLESRTLRDESDRLRRRLQLLDGLFGLSGDESIEEEPISGTRRRATVVEHSRVAS